MCHLPRCLNAEWMQADTGGGGTITLSSLSPLMLHSLHIPYREEAPPLFPKSSSERERGSPLTIYGVTMMQKTHPKAGFPACGQSLWKTKIVSGSLIHSRHHCLPLTFLLVYSQIRLFSVTVELCAYWTWNVFEMLLQEVLLNILGAFITKIKGILHGNRHIPHRFCLLDWGWSAEWIGIDNSVHVLHKAGNGFGISYHNRLAFF